MFTRNIKDTFTQGLLNAVSGVLGEAKKKQCAEGCECDACVPEEDTNEGYVSHAQRKAVWANRADDGKGHPDKKMKKEGYMPTNDAPSDKDRKTAGKLGAMLKREREAKEKKEPNGVKTEEVQDLDEGLMHNRYMRSHGKKARGTGSWAFTTKEYGSPKENEMHFTSGHKSLSDAHKEAATKLGTKHLYVMEEVEQIDETAKIVAHLQKRYGDNIRKSHVRSAAKDFGVDSSKLAKAVRTKLGKNILDEESDDDVPFKGPYRKAGERKDEYGNKVKNVAKHLAKKAMNAQKNEEVELDESDHRFASEKSKFDSGHRAKLLNPEGRMSYLSQKSYKTAKHAKEAAKFYHSVSHLPIQTIDNKMSQYNKKYDAEHKMAEEVEDLDEKRGLWDNIHAKRKRIKAGSGERMRKPGSKGAPSAADLKASQTEEVSVDEAFEQIDELSKATMGRYVNKAADRMSTQGVTAGLKIAADEKSKKNFDNIAKRQKGIATAVKKLTKEEQDFIAALNADTLDEARGRPKKAGAKDFTVHPKTKQKLMHNDPEDMKKIEALQRNGVIPVQKIEANQHVMQQLQRAKLSMRGGETVNFTHGDSHHVSGEHAAKLLTKYAGMKPNEKEAFQKKIGHSHANLKSEL